jgi:hypothetical protein
MKHRGGYRDRVALAPRQQGCVVGQLSRVDLAGRDLAQDGVSRGQLFTLAVLAAGQFDPGPDASRRATGDR